MGQGQLLRSNSPSIHERAEERQRETTRGKISSTKEISSDEDPLPRDKRTKAFARPSGVPMARSTCDGETEPLEQAEPLEAQMPSKSNPPKRAMLSEFFTVKETVLNKRPEGSELELEKL